MAIFEKVGVKHMKKQENMPNKQIHSPKLNILRKQKVFFLV